MRRVLHRLTFVALPFAVLQLTYLVGKRTLDRADGPYEHLNFLLLSTAVLIVFWLTVIRLRRLRISGGFDWR